MFDTGVVSRIACEVKHSCQAGGRRGPDCFPPSLFAGLLLAAWLGTKKMVGDWEGRDPRVGAI